MIIQKKIYNPMILTIPDDVVLFTILNPEDKMTRKIVMENYINFYAYKDAVSGISYFRFEDFKNYENLDGVEKCLVPMNLIKENSNSLGFLLELLQTDYVISLPIVKKFIDFYGQDADGTHVLFVYGADLDNEVFLCKDFDRFDYVDFTVSFEVMKKSLAMYTAFHFGERESLLAFRINERGSSVIEYAKVYSGFHKLKQDFSSRPAGYGLGAIDFYRKEIRGYPQNIHLIRCWYVLANYMRESVKLMKYRYAVLMEDMAALSGEFPDGGATIDNLSRNADILFFKTGIMTRKQVIADSDRITELSGLVTACRESFRQVCEYFCRAVSHIIKG